MGLVAVSNVPTTVQNLGIGKASEQSGDSFSQVLKSSISTQNSQQQKNIASTQNDNSDKQSSSLKVNSNQTENVKSSKDEINISENTTNTTKKNDKKEIDSTGAIAVQVNQTQTMLEDIKETLDEAISEIAGCLGITQTKLLEMMQTLKLSFKDLLTVKGIKELVNSSFGLTDSIDLLNNSKAFNAFKEIGQKVQALLDEKCLDVETVKNLLDDISNDDNLFQNIKAVNVSSVSDEQQKEMVIIQQTQQTQVQKTQQMQSQDSKDIAINIEDLRSNIANKDTQQQQSGEKESYNEFLGQLENQFLNMTTKGSDIITSTDVKEMVQQAVDAKDIFEQLVNQFKIALEDDKTTMSIQLKPENLGKVAFSLRSQNGVLTGHFVAENNAVKEAIEMNLANLKTSLTEQGIKFDEVKVVVGNTNQFFENDDNSRAFNQSSNNKRRRGSSNQAVESIGQKITDISEAMNIQDLESDEHMVDFSA